MLYMISLFLHITGALLLAAATGIEWVCIINLRKAGTIESVRQSIADYSKLAVTGGIAMALILFPGIYMMAVEWARYSGWIAVAFIGMVLMGIIGGTISSRRLRAAEKALKEGNILTPEIAKSVASGSLLFSIRLRTVIFLGIILIMVAKPVMFNSFIILAASIVIGLLPLTSRKPSGVIAEAESR